VTTFVGQVLHGPARFFLLAYIGTPINENVARNDMGLHTSGDVKRAAVEQGVGVERLDDFVRNFHMKNAYMKREAAFESCMRLEKNAAFGSSFGEIPPRELTDHL
jgi:hypothetical protein